MKVVKRLRNLSLSRKAFVISIVVLMEMGILWRLSLLDVAEFLEENLDNEMAWTVMIWYLKSFAVIYNAAFVLALVLRCRDVGVSIFYGIAIPAFALYLFVHFHDITPHFVVMFLIMYLIIKSGPSDVNLLDYIFEDN